MTDIPKWIEWMTAVYGKADEDRKKALDEISKVGQVTQRDLARLYVKPDCQQTIPVDAYFAPGETGRAQQNQLPVRRPIIAKLDDFFDAPATPIHGANQMVVLADAGMGKTLLLSWLRHRSIGVLAHFRPGRERYVLMALGPSTLEEIGRIETKYKTILLLDSLDEDRLAYGRVKERLMEILKATKPFYRVVLTCRTQFFPETVESSGRVQIGAFNCHATYLSLFDDKQVETYLEKLSPAGSWLRPEKRRRQKGLMEEAKLMIDKTGSLRCRPLLLAYIGDSILSAPDGVFGHDDQATGLIYSSEYAIYKWLVERWLDRQELKPSEKKIEGFADKLFRACQMLATELTLKRQQAITPKDLNLLVAQMQDPNNINIEAIDLGGKSLLNTNGNGDYRFAHSSFREFLLAHRILTDGNFPLGEWIPCSDLLKHFLAQGRAGLQAAKFRLRAMGLRADHLEGKDLAAVDLGDANLPEADLASAKLRGANAQVAAADFTSARLKKDHGGMPLEEFVTARLTHNRQDIAKGRIQGFTEELTSHVLLEMIQVPGGTFTMGSPKTEEDSSDDERPQHEVTVSPFCVGKFTVTQAQWRVVAGWPKVKLDLEVDPSHFKGHDRPVEQVSWEDAAEFCKRLSNKTGQTYRLPTEAEWEYACRAGTRTPFAFGETITPEFVNYNGNRPYGKAANGKYREETIPVGSLGVANGWGLYDMHGNVWEWCQDWAGSYQPEPVTDPPGPSEGEYRRLRGGSWSSNAFVCRSAFRHDLEPGVRNNLIGFRVVVVSRTP